MRASGSVVAIGQLRRPAPQSAHRPAGEQVVSAQARHRVARQQEDRPIRQEAEARRAGRPQRHAVERQFAQLRQHARGVILLADRRAARDQQHVGVGADSAARTASRVSGTSGSTVGSPPSRRTRAASMTELLSTMR